jgi:type I restriction enzyme M protein
MTTTTLSILESHLWEAANILRGSPVDRTDWKSYILPLMFFKWVCDARREFPNKHRFQDPDNSIFCTRDCD